MLYQEYRAMFRKPKEEVVHDGDTFRFLIDLGFEDWTERWIRLQGIDTPELSEYKRGKQARQFALDWFETYAKPYVYLWPQKATKTSEPGVFRQTFIRFVADIYSGPDKTGCNLAADLRAAGFFKEEEHLG